MSEEKDIDAAVFADTGFFLAFLNPENEPEIYAKARNFVEKAKKNSW